MTDQYGSNVISLLNFDSDYSDFTGKTWTPNGSASISTSTKKFGAGSLFVPSGSTHYLQSADSSDWSFGTGALTIECWINRAPVSANDECIIGNIDFSNVGWLFGINAAKRLIWRTNQSNGSNRVSSSTALNDNTWYHVAVTRDAIGTARVFINGILEGTGTDSENLTGIVGASIGRANYSGWQYGGYIDDLRVTKGVARYTTSFTPPTQAYTDPNELTITSVDELLTNGETASISGEYISGLSLQLGNASTLSSSTTIVNQADVIGDDTDATFSVVAGELPTGTVYVFAENGAGQSNSVGYAVSLIADAFINQTFVPARTDDQQQRITANYMPHGTGMDAKNRVGKTMFKQLRALSKTFNRVETAINDFLNGIVITKSSNFVDEWEKTLGVPDESFFTQESDEERRRYCVLKLSAENMATKEELEWLLGTYGISCTVYPGLYFYYNYNPDVGTFSSIKEARFTIVFGVDLLASEPAVYEGSFPWTFPHYFSRNRVKIAQDFMREIIPANVNARWFYDGDIIQDSSTETEIWQDDSASTDIIQDV